MNTSLPSIYDTTSIRSRLHAGRPIFVSCWCPICQRDMKCWISLRYLPDPNSPDTSHSAFDGTHFSISCSNCTAKGHTIWLFRDGQLKVVLFWNSTNSIATENSPEAVRYFCLQAMLSFNVGAYSASLAMYRSALDALLFHEGFESGMVGQKLAALEKQFEKDQQPDWYRYFNPKFLKVIKNLANSSLHISDKDISKESNLTGDDVRRVELVFGKLLYEVYERKAEDDAALKELEALEKRKSNKKS